MPRGKGNERLHSSLNWDPASGLSLLHKREELLHTQTCTGSGEERKARQASSSTDTASHPRQLFFHLIHKHPKLQLQLGPALGYIQGPRVEWTQL